MGGSGGGGGGIGAGLNIGREREQNKNQFTYLGDQPFAPNTPGGALMRQYGDDANFYRGMARAVMTGRPKPKPATGATTPQGPGISSTKPEEQPGGPRPGGPLKKPVSQSDDWNLG